jgi:FemAB-related protein (PEP-CTERM system-associated)
MELKELTEVDYARWDDYVLSHEKGTFFHLSAWQEIIESVFKHKTYYLYVEDAGEIKGVLPLTHISSPLFANGLFSNAFSVYGGPLYSSPEALAILDKRALNLRDELKGNYVEYRNLERVHDDWDCNDSLYAYFRREINEDPEADLLKIPRKQRAVLRKTLDGRINLNHEWQDNIDDFFHIYSQSVKGLGTPVFPKRFFKALLEAFPDRCKVSLVKNEQGKKLTALMTFYYKDTVLPYYGGGIAAARNVGAYDFMYWTVLADAREKGYKIFDFGRSKVGTGAYYYKKNWGIEPQPLYYEYALTEGQEMPNINPLNPKYQLFIMGWKLLPLSLANFLGPYIVRQVG